MTSQTSTTEQPQAQRRFVRALMAAVALLIAVTGLTLTGTATAYADTTSQSTTQSTGQSAGRAGEAPDAEGYFPVKDITAYVFRYEAELAQYGDHVLHIDTEHMDAGGFWFATTYGDAPRGFSWTYQPWGLKCTYANMRMSFNAFMNAYNCVGDMAALDASENSANHYVDSTKACRAESGRPWATGSQGGNYARQCGNGLLARGASAVNIKTGNTPVCAPWEPSNCQKVTYPWATNPDPMPWAPAPDTCTGAQADANRYETDYAPWTNTTSDPTCDGSAPAPNCASVDAFSVNHAACGGPLQYPVFDGLTESGTVDNGSGSTGVTSTQSATATSNTSVVMGSAYRRASEKVQRGRIARVAVARYHGRVFRVRRAAPVFHVGKAGETRYANVQSEQVTVTVTATCNRPTQAEADQCALALAQDQAQAAADKAANDAAQAKATAQATADAAAAAKAKAAAEARHGAITRGEKARASRMAMKAARTAVNRMVRAYAASH